MHVALSTKLTKKKKNFSTHFLNMEAPDAAPLPARRPHAPAKFRFFVHCATQFGDSVLVCGDHHLLGNWKPALAFALQWDGVRNDGTWIGPHVLSIPCNEHARARIEYKYIIKRADGGIVWENRENRHATSMTCVTQRLVDEWNERYVLFDCHVQYWNRAVGESKAVLCSQSKVLDAGRKILDAYGRCLFEYVLRMVKAFHLSFKAADGQRHLAEEFCFDVHYTDVMYLVKHILHKSNNNVRSAAALAAIAAAAGGGGRGVVPPHHPPHHAPHHHHHVARGGAPLYRGRGAPLAAPAMHPLPFMRWPGYCLPNPPPGAAHHDPNIHQRNLAENKRLRFIQSCRNALAHSGYAVAPHPPAVEAYPDVRNSNVIAKLLRKCIQSVEFHCERAQLFNAAGNTLLWNAPGIAVFGVSLAPPPPPAAAAPVRVRPIVPGPINTPVVDHHLIDDFHNCVEQLNGIFHINVFGCRFVAWRNGMLTTADESTQRTFIENVLAYASLNIDNPRVRKALIDGLCTHFWNSSDVRDFTL